jgi:hypothetical protein
MSTDDEIGGDKPLAFILAIMRDVNRPLAVRMQAAVAAAPYCHPRLASVEKTDTPWVTQEEAVKAMLNMW